MFWTLQIFTQTQISSNYALWWQESFIKFIFPILSHGWLQNCFMTLDKVWKLFIAKRCCKYVYPTISLLNIVILVDLSHRKGCIINDKDQHIWQIHRAITSFHLICITYFVLVITLNSAKKFREQTDLSIVLVGEKTGPLPPDNTLNIAISVSAIAVLIIIIIALCVMQHKCG